MSSPAFISALWRQDAKDAAAAWANVEFKGFAVHVITGPEKRPTSEQIVYVRARDRERAIATAQRNLITKPARARYAARLAGPAELGCVRTPSPQTTKAAA